MISLRDVRLELPVFGSIGRKGGRLTGSASSAGGSILHDGNSGYKIVALDGITLEIVPGDRVVIIGPNGAGKSSLLRVMAGIYQPTSGQCIVRGKISTLFSTSIGMDPNATGYENIYRAGLMLGQSHKAIMDAMPEIIDLCALGDFIHMPVRTYSSGMRMRLGFAVAVSQDPDILLIDEVMGAGDSTFMAKARERFNNMMNKARTVVMASHSEGMAKRFCNKAIWLDKGRLIMYGQADDVLAEYKKQTQQLLK